VSPVKYELGFISQKTAFFVVTAVETSNLNKESVVCLLKRETLRQIYTGTCDSPKTLFRVLFVPFPKIRI
jgi:hypothetical protein